MLAPKSTSRKKRAYRTPKHRLRSVKLVLKGFSTVEVAKTFGDSQTAVSSWVRRFRKHGAEGLNDVPRSGRPSRITPSQERKLKAFMARARSNAEKLSGGILAAHIKKSFGIALTRRQCERILKRMREGLV